MRPGWMRIGLLQNKRDIAKRISKKKYIKLCFFWQLNRMRYPYTNYIGFRAHDVKQ